MIIEILLLIIGIAAVLIIPGYFFSGLFFKKLGFLERACIGFGLSVFLLAAVNLFLYALGFMLSKGGITASGIWVSVIVLSFVFMLLSKYL